MINAESYFLKKKQSFQSDINLDGVGATEEIEYDYQGQGYTSMQEHDELLVFESLKDKVGLFVIDLVGAGLQSRAVIQKGNLTLVQKV